LPAGKQLVVRRSANCQGTWDLAVEFNRNQFMMFGVIVLLLGVEFRMFDSFTLNEKATHFIASRMGESSAATAVVPAAVTRKVLRPPPWLGWSLISVGSVLILHSFGMRKPGG
jgi:hypothetical protein